MMEEILQRFKVINVSEIAKNLGKTVRIGSYEIALFHLANGEFRAIENRCPHKGGVLVEARSWLCEKFCGRSGK